MELSASGIKTLVKDLLWRGLSDRDGLADVRVLSGPARGTRMRVDLRSEASYWAGSYDAGILGQFTRFLGPGKVAYDCGAYLGIYAAAMRRAVGPSGTVHVFEASRANYERVAQMPGTNGWSNVHVHHLAVGEAHSTLRFASNLGATSRPADALGVAPPAGVEVEVVECAGIDELVYERGLPAPDAIKLDLETSEIFALANGARLWTEKRPVVLVELHYDNGRNPGVFDAMERFLAEYRYRGVEVRLKRPVSTVEEFIEAEASTQCTVLATPAD